MDQAKFRAEVVADIPSTVICVAGDLDLAAAPTLRTLLGLAAEHDRRIVVDMERVDFIDSIGVSVLLAAARRARDAHREFAVRNPTPVALRIFGLLSLNGQLPIEPVSEL
jgi:anti-sigma B factor antagonist